MKRIATVLTVLLISSGHLAFSQSFDDGTNLVSVGFGLPPGRRIVEDFKIYKTFTDYRLKNYGTIVLKYEHGLHKYFGIGINTEYSGSSVHYLYDDNANAASPRYQVHIKSNVFAAYARMNGHVSLTDNFDLYAGAGLGYMYTVNNRSDTNPNVNTNITQKSTVLDFDFQLTLGARYMVKENVGIFVEVGRATTVCQLGLALKF